MLVSRGSHTHHPPYPTKLPKDIAEDIVAVIEQHDLLDLTAGKLSICGVDAEYIY